MRIAVITINDLQNYGNRLQNYAVHYIFHQMGYVTENIIDKTFFDPLYKESKKAWIKEFVKNPVYSIRVHTKKKRFENFNKFFCWFNQCGIKKITKEIEDVFDYFVVGSDQVWNPDFALSDVTVLKNVDKNKRISFSASFGVSEVDDGDRAKIIEEIGKFKAISVREEAGATLIRNLTGKTVTVLADPTMLLSKEEWRKVEKKPKYAKTRYVLTCFLSDRCEKAEKIVRELSADYQIYELNNWKDCVAGAAGPAEFLWLIDHAKLVLTDSFHACVFSFLFDKPFVVYDRNWNEGNMNSRLETFLSLFHLERKYVNSDMDNYLWEHNYIEGYRQLEKEKGRSLAFLNRVLKE